MTAERYTDRGAMQHLAAALADLASEAGACILRVNAEQPAPRIKPDQTPATAADDAAEELILEALERILPGVPVIAEEAASRRAPPLPRGSYLLVDPIDGTRELIAGRGEYTVNIALVEAHRPVLGVVYAPRLAELYVGGGGRALRQRVAPGARFDAAQAAPIRARPRPPALVALVSRSHPDAAADAFLARLPVARKIPLGSSLKFARLAEGAADVFVRLATIREWDIGAGHALLAAAGGEVTAPDGAPLAYGARADGFSVTGFVAWGAPPGT